MKTISWFEELGRGDVAIAGGKGANLGELARAGMPVPPGFVITADVFLNFLEKNGIRQKIYEMLKINVEDTALLQSVAAEVKQIVTSARMPDDVSKAITKAYADLARKGDIIIAGRKDLAVAVRSSATAEDLPGASFAGQQATFLGVRGAGAVLKAVQECWASLFEPRSIYYRMKKGFPHEKVSIAVIIEKMAISDKAGVMFTLHPATGDQSVIVIEGAYGLGESVVSGEVTPDTYIVEKSSLRIRSKDVSNQAWMWEGSFDGGKRKKDVNRAMRKEQKVPDSEIVQIARLGRQIEEHYQFPQDIEWAVEKGIVYIVQSRPVTAKVEGIKDVEQTIGGPTVTRREAPDSGGEKVEADRRMQEEMPSEETGLQFAGLAEVSEGMESAAGGALAAETTGGALATGAASAAAPATVGTFAEGEMLVKGLGASPGIAVGPVKLIKDASELSKVLKGDILVTKMTDPDMVPAMERAAAIVTDEGGLTAHAAIVSRELRIPCIVGTQKATQVLTEGMRVTVDAIRGVVYKGEVKVETTEEAKPESPFRYGHKIITGTQVKVNIDFPRMAQEAAHTGADGVGLLRAEHMIISLGKHPKRFAEEGKLDEYVQKLREGIQKVCEAFYPNPVWYRTLDAPTDEFRGLEGGEDEPKEANPMLGWRGIRRGLDQPGLIRSEFRALKAVYEAGFTNVGVMLPLVQDAKEVARAREIAVGAGLPAKMEFGVMVETPAAALSIEDIVAQKIDFISFGTNDLTQYTLAIDRDNALMASRYNPTHPAVLKLIEHVVKVCQKAGVKTSICGEAGSDPKMLKFLVDLGIDSLSVNIDAVGRTRELVAREEKRLVLEAARKGLEK